ncbi:MAG: metal-dependent hydrolase [Sulfurovum sp.]|nr:metal-dependent hydrolase [Sulfurovum sp.]
MASFQQHVNISVIASGVLVVPLHSAGLLSIYESLVMLILGVVGGMLPDLDLDHSKPSQIFFRILSIFVPLMILLQFSEEVPVIQMMILWVIFGLFLHFVLRKTLAQMTTHRGIFHTIPMGILFAQMALYTSQELLEQTVFVSSIVAFFIFFGFIIHLLLDEIYSVNFAGIQMKKSFGTALKIYDKNNLIGTAILYILILVFLQYAPIESDIFIEILSILKDIKLF